MKATAECQAAAICAVDPTACENYRISVCNDDATAAMAAGVRHYDSANAQPCIDALNAAYGNGHNEILFAALVGPGTLGDKCARVFSGNLDVNQTCTTDYDCTSNRICAPVAPGSSDRVCATPAMQTLGGFCANPGSECPPDAYCALPSSGAAQCIASAASGQPCDASVPCVSEDRCDNSLCAPRAMAGGLCATNADCGATDPYCDAYAGNICTVGLTFAAGAFDCREFLPGIVDAGGVTVVSNGD